MLAVERGFLIVYIMEQDWRIMKKFKMEIKGSDLEISAFFKGLANARKSAEGGCVGAMLGTS